jgi:hypothetical protein
MLEIMQWSILFLPILEGDEVSRGIGYRFTRGLDRQTVRETHSLADLRTISFENLFLSLSLAIRPIFF